MFEYDAKTETFELQQNVPLTDSWFDGSSCEYKDFSYNSLKPYSDSKMAFYSTGNNIVSYLCIPTSGGNCWTSYAQSMYLSDAKGADLPQTSVSHTEQNFFSSNLSIGSSACYDPVNQVTWTYCPLSYTLRRWAGHNAASTSSLKTSCEKAVPIQDGLQVLLQNIARLCTLVRCSDFSTVGCDAFALELSNEVIGHLTTLIRESMLLFSNSQECSAKNQAKDMIAQCLSICCDVFTSDFR